MSLTEQQAAEKIAKEIADAKRSAEENGGKVTNLEQRVAAAEAAMLEMRQAQAAAQRAALETAAGSEDELKAYVVRSEGARDDLKHVSVQDQGQKYHLNREKGIGVRLLGHFEEIPIGREVVRNWRWGLLDDPRPKSLGQLAAQRMITLRNILHLHGKKLTPHADLAFFDALRQCGPVFEKIFADSSGIGAEWIPTKTLPEVERAILVPTGLAAMFRRRVMQPGTNTIPKRSGNLRLYKGAVPTADNPADAILSSITTSSVDIDSVEGVVASQVHRNALRDSELDVAAELLLEIIETINFADSDSIVNGDSAASHQDAIASWNTRSRLGSSGLGTSADHRRRCRGLRARAFDLTSMTTDQNAATDFAGARTALGKLGADNMTLGYMQGNNIVYLTSWEYFFAKILGWSEFASWEKVGALASALTGKVGDTGATPGGMLPGQVGFLQGFVPVCISHVVTADLAATGLFTGSGALTTAVQFDRSRFEYVVQEGATVEAATNILNNTETFVARVRNIPLRELDAVSSSIKDVHASINLPST